MIRRGASGRSRDLACSRLGLRGSGVRRSRDGLAREQGRARDRTALCRATGASRREYRPTVRADDIPESFDSAVLRVARALTALLAAVAREKVSSAHPATAAGLHGSVAMIEAVGRITTTD
ncbi:MAG: hypothetical protein ACOCTH_03750 [Halodesulfurarchaeum sp.]